MCRNVFNLDVWLDIVINIFIFNKKWNSLVDLLHQLQYNVYLSYLFSDSQNNRTKCFFNLRKIDNRYKWKNYVVVA